MYIMCSLYLLQAEQQIIERLAKLVPCDHEVSCHTNVMGYFLMSSHQALVVLIFYIKNIVFYVYFLTNGEVELMLKNIAKKNKSWKFQT